MPIKHGGREKLRQQSGIERKKTVIQFTRRPNIEASGYSFDDGNLFVSISMLFRLDVVSLAFPFRFCLSNLVKQLVSLHMCLYYA